jgi:hypothetical protein
MKTRHQIVFAVLYFLSISCFANVVIDKAKSDNSQTSGYVENTQVYFSVLDGQSLNPIRAMQRITVELNDKLITIQRSKDHKEFYIKGQDKSGHITLLGSNDYDSIAKVIEALKSSSDSANYPEVFELLNSTFNLLASYPNNMPLLIWQNNKTDIAALTSDSVIDNKRISKIKSVDNALFFNSDKLQFPDVTPYQANGFGTQSKSQAKVEGTDKQLKSYNSKESLCSSIGQIKDGSFPVISKSLSISRIHKYSAKVGGEECLGRCGGECTYSITGVPSTANTYSKDCLDHDMCSVRTPSGGGFAPLGLECNAIFAHAEDDFFNLPSCEHDLKVEKFFVTKTASTSPYSQSKDLTSEDDLKIALYFGNKGKHNLPHNKNINVTVSYQSLSDPGVKTAWIEAKPNPKNSAWYEYNIGKLKKGDWQFSYKINASSINEATAAAQANNNKKALNLTIKEAKTTGGTGYTKIANNGSTLPDSAKLGTKPTDWACTKDNKTGLIWEVKTDDGGLRDKDNTYTNYDSIYPRCNWIDCEKIYPGKLGDSTNTDSFVKAVNNNGLCGIRDWRLPKIEELSELLVCSDGHYSTNVSNLIYCDGSPSSPTVNKTYFPDIVKNFWFWSSYNDGDWGGVVDFKYGNYGNTAKGGNYSVRLVK